MWFLKDWKELGNVERRIVVAAFLGWSLDAFDFFLLVFVLKDVARTFSVSMTTVTAAIFLTLATRPLGALLFGLLSDRIGRRPILMVVILLYSMFGFLSAMATTLWIFLLLRALYGVAMGGEWGTGASLAMEKVPPSCRGLVSGILQAGYPAGYLLAALSFAVVYPFTGWRGLLMLGILPALLVFFIRKNIPERPPAPGSSRLSRASLGTALGRNWRRGIFAIVLMTAFNFMGHGTQDLYPTFLELSHHLDPKTVGEIAIFYNVGAILGGIVLGTVSERAGRRRAILFAAAMAIVTLPLWGLSTGIAAIALGSFLMQFAVQGAWGVVPAYLNEISPNEIRATFPGVVYQTGNLLAAANASIQSRLSQSWGGRLDLALMAVAGTSATVIALLIMGGPERRGERLSPP